MIHFIHESWNSKLIIALTECGLDWLGIEDFTSHKELVTCKKCLKKLCKEKK